MSSIRQRKDDIEQANIEVQRDTPVLNRAQSAGAFTISPELFEKVL